MLLHRALLFAFLTALAAAPASGGEPAIPLPAEVREHLVKKHFPGGPPAPGALERSLEFLRPPQRLLLEAAEHPWAGRQLGRFGPGKLFFVLRKPDGTSHLLLYRNGKPRKNRLLTPARLRVLRRLYDGALYERPPHPLLARALDNPPEDPAAAFRQALERVRSDGRFPLSEEDGRRALENASKARDRGRPLAAALAALSGTERGVECLWAALWLLSRMDRMAFHRKGGAGSMPDLQGSTARQFFENVYCAVEARRTFPWGADVSDEDFLQHVLSPRGTSEPLQRWRRPFYEALEPELGALEGGAEETLALVRAVSSDVFQYEGATSWEDFGMLTALAVHEGRCEDCSNVLNCLLRAAGLPAAQAFTPWWAHADGNHAWTVVPSLDGGRNPNGLRAAKVYLKTWDGLRDITDKNTDVLTLRVPLAAAPDARPALQAWNHSAWRTLARGRMDGGEAVFERVGCGRPFVFLVKAPDAEAALVHVAKGGRTTVLRSGEPDPAAESWTCRMEKSSPLGEFRPDESYRVFTAAGDGWKKLEAERLSTGAVAFPARPGRLYRVWGKGLADRPFLVRRAEDGSVVVEKR